MANRQVGQVLYWFITGGLLGFGLISFDIFFLAIPCLLVGLGLVIFGIIRWGPHNLWAAFIGFGAIPAFFLISDIIRSYPPCPPQGLMIPPNAPSGTTLSCGYTPPTYYFLLTGFVIIALIGAVWPLLRRRVRG